MSQGRGPFFKILRADLTHHGLTYREGLNVDPLPFDPTEQCGPGGIYYADQEHIGSFTHYGDLIARVTLPPDARCVAVGPDKFKADRVVLSDIKPWRESERWRQAALVRHMQFEEIPMPLTKGYVVFKRKNRTVINN